MNGCASLGLALAGGCADAGKAVDAASAEPVAGPFEGKHVGVVEDATIIATTAWFSEDPSPAEERRLLIRIRDACSWRDETSWKNRFAARSLAADGTVRAVVLTDAGRAFSAGDGLGASLNLNEDTFTELIESFQDVTRAILGCPQPVIAAVDGIAVGGAAEITLVCDVRVGGPATEYFFPENGIGLTISNGSSLLLPLLVGRRALGVVLLRRRMDTTEASALGFLDRIVSSTEHVLPEAVTIAHELVAKGTGTRHHLALLRLDTEAVEAAMRREVEVEVARIAWVEGLVQEGLEASWGSRG